MKFKKLHITRYLCIGHCDFKITNNGFLIKWWMLCMSQQFSTLIVSNSRYSEKRDIDMSISEMIRYNISVYDSYDQCHTFKGNDPVC